MKCFQVLVFTFLFPFFSIKADEALENAYILVVEDTDVDADQMRFSVDANLSVNDLVVTNNISMNDSASSSVGNIMKNGVRFIHNFGNNNTFTGIRAGNFTMSGDSNSGFGTNALRRTVSGRGNTAIGTNALTENVTGTQNTAVGFRSMESANNSSFNTAVGYRSLLNS